VIPWLAPGSPPEAFPPVEQALAEPDGLLCAGGDLEPGRLLAAYRRGIFPWYSQGQPILWWSPDPRTVLRPEALRISRSLARTLRRGRLHCSVDRDFRAVVAACGDPQLRPEGTWITAEMRRAYARLHDQGYAHSIEVWTGESLVGGIYGVALGKVFFGESMFSRVPDASKVAMARLCAELRLRGYRLLDCQIASAHLARLGAGSMPRRDFTALLDAEIEDLDARTWEVDPAPLLP
jgi:leucyl/phenylalanyl-tRNA--protein transferase